jgi:hypothetical protein
LSAFATCYRRLRAMVTVQQTCGVLWNVSRLSSADAKLGELWLMRAETGIR